MPTRLIDKYVPNPTPVIGVSAALRNWLDEEHQLIAERLAVVIAYIDALRTTTRQFLFDGAAAFTLDTTPVQLSNFASGVAVGDGIPDGTIDTTAGTITIPGDGFYNILVWLIGSHTQGNQNETIQVDILINGSPVRIWNFDVARNQSLEKTINAGFIRELKEGDIIAIQISATDSFGTFTPTDTLIECSRVVNPENPNP